MTTYAAMEFSAAAGGSAASAGAASAAVPWGSIAQAAGGVIGAIGALSASRASARSLRKQAKLARMEGREAKRLSDYRVRLIHQEGAELLGANEAETAKSGLAMTGSPLATLVDNARRIELSAALEKRAGTITQQRYEQQASALEADARAVKKAGKISAIGSLLGG